MYVDEHNAVEKNGNVEAREQSSWRYNTGGGRAMPDCSALMLERV